MDDPTPVTPVAGYVPVSVDNLAKVNANKKVEELLLQHIEAANNAGHDPRWLAIAKTHIEQAFMAFNRAIMQPVRVGLAEFENLVLHHNTVTVQPTSQTIPPPATPTVSTSA